MGHWTSLDSLTRWFWFCGIYSRTAARVRQNLSEWYWITATKGMADMYLSVLSLRRTFTGMPSLYCGRFLTCICLIRRLFRVTLEISRAECNTDVTPGTLTATDTCIGYHVTRFEASRKVILHTRYVSTCVRAGGGRGRGTKIKTKANRCGACYVFNVWQV
jgi:hypothetical protein